jgi:microcystin-dependent protein
MDFSVGQLLLLPLPPGFVPEGTLQCNGQLVSISKWPKLYDVLSISFGGDGADTFGIPDIPPMQTAGGVSIHWFIVAEGASFGGGSAPLYGEVRLFVMQPFKGPWRLCSGGLLPIAGNEALYSLLGTTFGGNGTTSFGVPKMAPITLANGAELDYYIALDGVFPSTSCDATTPVNSPSQSYDSLLSTIFFLPYPNAGGLCGFALCQGQTLRVANPWLPLFALLGNQFGGTGATNFLLPNLPAVGGVNFALLYNGVYPSRSS